MLNLVRLLLTHQPENQYCKAGQMTSNLDPPPDIKNIGWLKIYWCNETDFAQFFIDMSKSERTKYTELQLKAL